MDCDLPRVGPCGASQWELAVPPPSLALQASGPSSPTLAPSAPNGIKQTDTFSGSTWSEGNADTTENDVWICYFEVGAIRDINALQWQ